MFKSQTIMIMGCMLTFQNIPRSEQKNIFSLVENKFRYLNQVEVTWMSGHREPQE